MKLKIRGHHADNRERLGVERYRLTDNIRLPAKPALPKSVAEHGRRSFVGSIVVRRERATKDRIDSQHSEELRSGKLHGQFFGFACSREIDALIRECSHALETRALIAPTAIVRARGRVLVTPVRGHFPQHHDAIGVAVGQWTQQQLVHDREDSRVRTDAQRKRNHGNRGEGFVFREHARAVTRVLRDGFKQAASFDVVGRIDRSIEVAETPQCLFACFTRRHPGLDVFVNLQLEVRA